MLTIVFGYGSLMNSESVNREMPHTKIIGKATLGGYRRKANAVHERFPDVAMNIAPDKEMSVEGVLLEVPDSDMPALLEREMGYEMIDVTNQITPKQKNKVFTFMAPDVSDCQGKKIYQAYIDVCLAGVSDDKREQWIAETEFICEITCECRKSLYKKHFS